MDFPTLRLLPIHIILTWMGLFSCSQLSSQSASQCAFELEAWLDANRSIESFEPSAPTPYPEFWNQLADVISNDGKSNDSWSENAMDSMLSVLEKEEFRDIVRFWQLLGQRAGPEKHEVFGGIKKLQARAFDRRDSLLGWRCEEIKGNFYEDYGLKADAMASYAKTIQFFNRKGSAYHRAVMLMNIGNEAFYNGEYESASGHYLIVDSMLKEIGSQKLRLRLLANLSTAAYWLDDTLAERSYNAQALDLNAKLNDKSMAIQIAYMTEILNRLRIEKDSALVRARLLELLDESRMYDFPGRELLITEALGFHYKSMGPKKRAVAWFARSVALADTLQLYWKAASLADDQAECYEALEDYENAYALTQQAYELRSKYTYKEAKSSREFYRTQFETEKKDREIAEQELELQEEAARSERIRSTGLLGGAGALFLLGMAAFAYRNQRNKRKAAELQVEQHDLKTEKQVAELVARHRYETVVAHVEGEEKERQRLAKEIHDGVGGVLAGLAMRLESINLDEAPGVVADVAVKLRTTQDDLRNISHNLSLPQFKENTLVELSAQLLSNFKTTSRMEVGFNVFPKDKPFRLDYQLEVGLYRILQELTTNVSKHAEATSLEVSLTLLPDELNLMVSDNGKGFDPETSKNGLGLRSMAERVDALSGKLTIDSKRGQGTTTTVVIMHPKRQDEKPGG